METVGWATAMVGSLGGGALVLGYALDQVPALSAKAEKAITALRRLRAAWHGKERQEDLKDDERKGDESR
ncbi:hypothetical protein ACFW95_45645 [Streptomyces sp. NPDC059474]|uniref:hypothetical protein n=1 Tax=Streptomyces sp. NPDC059474 TaxID=3346846 RepID=UPI0036AB6BAA